MAPRKRKATGSEGSQPKRARTTRSMTTDSSRQAVLNTTELVELILLHLPARNIFGIQRVCKQFRDLISTSKPVQQRLFLKPSIKPQLWKIQRVDEDDVDAPLAARYTGQRLKVVVCSTEVGSAIIASMNSDPKTQGQRALPVKLNPLLSVSNNPHAPRSLVDRIRLSHLLRPTIDLGDAPLMQPQSWRKMLLTDPPVDEASIFLHWSVKGSRGSRRDYAFENQIKDRN